MNSIDPKRFYDSEVIARRKAADNRMKQKPGWVKRFRKMPANILGPPEFWREFNKQADALHTAAKESNDFNTLCTFVYQRDNGYRKFVVAHPERYWWHYKHRPPEERCSYEIIPEYCPCRLYLDLEYVIELNPGHDGSSMTNTIIEVFCAYLLARWSLPCNTYNVVNLDSSTGEKFSRHLVFNVKHVAFKDNYHVGRLVKRVCQDILDYLAFEETSSNDVLNRFHRTELERLIVETKNGKRLFIDTAVYTKNRHFRIYQSTKWGKRSNFTLSADCKYVPSVGFKDKELAIFLDSLVSHFGARKDLVILEYSDDKDGIPNATSFKQLPRRSIDREDSHTSSKYPLLDKYVRYLTRPGRVRSCKNLESGKLVYDTSGYRYCENIGRCHQSNNVYWVIDLNAKRFYQKCHDQDCAGFKSEPKRLPEEVCFEIDEDGDTLLSSVSLTEDLP